MNKSNMKSNGQAGFTLIELIVVIVILGILAATALPKFSSLGGDARLASLNAAKGALSSTAAMAKGKFLVNATGTPLPSITVEGATITYTASGNGYPKATTGLADAAGLSADYLVIGPDAPATDNTVKTEANEIMIVPQSLEGTVGGKTCYLKYKEPANKADVPVLTMVATATGCE